MGAPRDQPTLAGEIGKSVKAALAPAIERIVTGGAVLIFMFIFVPIGVVAFVATGALFAILMAVFGTPAGLLGSVLGVAWFVGTLVLVFVVFVITYRRLPHRLRGLAAAPGADDDAAVAPPPMSTPTPTVSLAELDARLAPRGSALPEDPGPAAGSLRRRGPPLTPGTRDPGSA